MWLVHLVEKLVYRYATKTCALSQEMEFFHVLCIPEATSNQEKLV